MNTAALDKEALTILRQLKEPELTKHFVQPLFEAQGWRVVNVHGDVEEAHGCDLMLYSEAHSKEAIVIGVQVKAYTDGANNITNSTNAKKIRVAADTALRYPVGTPPVRFAKFLWITAGWRSQDGEASLAAEIEKFELLSGRVEVWDCNDLCRQLDEARELQWASGMPTSEIFALYQINMLRRQILALRPTEGVFAGVAAYRVLRQALRLPRPDIDLILDTIDTSISAIRTDPRYRGYYYRLLGTVLTSWQQLLDKKRPLFREQTENLAISITNDDFQEACSSTFGADAEMVRFLLRDFEAIFRQLEQLERHYVNGPAGLSTLQICRLLLRVGFPPTSPSIAARLDRVCDELRSEDYRSIDGACSLCTGTALSCLALSHSPMEIEACVTWLSGLRSSRFCHQGRDYGKDRAVWENALHYAASVLLGLIDLKATQSELDLSALLQEVMSVFFPSKDLEGDAFISDWMRFRNVDRFEVYHDIFASFLALAIRHGDLPAEESKAIAMAIKKMIEEIRDDCGDIAKWWFIYAARTNLDTFSLGLLLEIPEAIPMARQVTRLFRFRASRAIGKTGDPLWDSSIDRTTVFLESYLNYWETLFYLRERGVEITRFLPAVEPPDSA